MGNSTQIDEALTKLKFTKLRTEEGEVKYMKGAFRLVINILIVYWASEIVEGFRVAGWGSALLFSILVSIVSSFLERLINQYDSSDSNL